MRSGRPSATAVLIARATVLLAREPQAAGLVPRAGARVADACLRAAGDERWRRLCGAAWWRRLVMAVESAVLPGLVRHFALRKRFIAAAAARAVIAGAGQVVVVAAGADALASRLSRVRPGLAAFELDHPATQAVKRRTLAALAADDVRLVACDLGGEGPAAALVRAGFAPTCVSVFVLEGLLMYLPHAAVAALLADLATIAAPGSTLIATWMETQEGEVPAFADSGGLTSAWLRRHREPFVSGATRAGMAAQCASVGFAVERIADHHGLRRWLPRGSRAAAARGESVLVATRRG